MRRPLFVLMLVAVAGAMYGVREGTARCTKGVMFAPKRPGTAYILGAARPDTVLAGSGPVDYVIGGRVFGRSTAWPIYGQLFLVERMGTPASSSLPAAVAAVAIVPWGYGADCRPTPWTRSARWLPVGERGVVTGVLRERRYWVDGMPTIDVHMPQAQPYPQSVAKASHDSALTADELFTLLEMVPELELLEKAPREAIVPFREWLQANPAIARRWPANETANILHWDAESNLLQKTVPPIAGTYRFTVPRPGRDSAVFFVRTSPRATTMWRRPAGPPPSPLVDIRGPDSYYVRVATSTAERDLPLGDGDRVMDREGHIGLVHEPRTRPDGSREWDAQFDFRFIERTLLANMRITNRGDAFATDGVFVMDPQGRVRAEATIGRASDQPVILRGERISTTSLDSRR